VRLPRSALSGNYAILATDATGASKLPRAMPGQGASTRDRAYSELMQQHDYVITAFAKQYEVVGRAAFTGDGLYFIFRDAENAIRCALAIQARLRNDPLQTPNGPLEIRIGMHFGNVEIERSRNCRGDAMNMAARILDATRPSEILASPEIVALAERRLQEIVFPSAGIKEFKQEERWELRRVVARAQGTPNTHDAPIRVLAERYSEHIYRYSQYASPTIRIVGSGDEHFPPSRVHLTYDPAPYEMPEELEAQRDDVVALLKDKARNENHKFWDGPNARLVRLYQSARDQTENQHIELTFGPIGWFDYSAVDYLIRQARNTGRERDLERYLDYGAISQGDLSSVRLTNILTTLIVPITVNGTIICHSRSRQVSSEPGKLACIAENIHTEFDSLDPAQPLPDPFLAVGRGLREELSPSIPVNAHDVHLIGLCFGLDSLLPALIFLVVLPFTYDEVLSQCLENPGKDFWEGEKRALPIDPGERRFDQVMRDPTWYGTGQAAIIRALEFVRATQARCGGSLHDALERISHRHG
jgi:class 3 adenylate cyclase